MNYLIAARVLRMARTALFVVTGLLAVLLATRAESVWKQLFVVETGALAIVFIAWAHSWCDRWLKNRYRQETLDAEQILSELSHSISGIRDPKILVEIVGRKLSDCLHASPVRVLVDRLDAFANGDYLFGKNSPVVRHLLRLQGPARIDAADAQSWIYGMPAQDTAVLGAMDARVLVPMTVDRRVVGLISVGPKRWDMPFSLADLQLLTAAASQTALALDNARLSDDIRAEIAARERASRELEIARDVQQRLFPQVLPEVDGLDFAGYCRPALGVGGDYYDFIRLDDGSLGIAIGDVSGKGIAAALMMASLQASLRGQTLLSTTVSETIGRINRLVYEASAENRYATFFYARYDPSACGLEYVNAGHNAPMLLRSGEIVRLEQGGTVIGLFRNAVYEQGRLTLQPGDVLLAFTDGISEALNGRGEEFGEQKLVDALQNRRSRKAAEMISNILNEVDGFVQDTDQHDDMTLVAVRVSGTK